MSIFHHKRRRLFVANEATPGTAIADASLFVLGNGKVPVYDLKCTPQAQNLDRNPDGLTFDSVDSVRWGENYQITFQTDAYTSGSAGTAPGYAQLLKSCGMVESVSAGVSVTYTVDSDACPTSTMGVELINDAGTASKKIIVAGCLGSFTLAADMVGKPGRISWTFVGKAAYVTSTLQVLDGTPVGSVVYDDAVANLPQLKGVSLTVGGVSRQVNNLSFDRGLTTEFEVDMSDTTGYLKRIVASSAPKLTIDPAKVTEATQADITRLFAGTSGAIAVTFGSTAGKRLKINLARAQSESLSDDARGVTSTWGITFRANRSSVTGNGDDAVTVVFD